MAPRSRYAFGAHFAEMSKILRAPQMGAEPNCESRARPLAASSTPYLALLLRCVALALSSGKTPVLME